MKIVSPELQEMLEQKKPVAIEFGSGDRPRDGFFHIDLVEMDRVDVVADLNDPLSCFPDDSVIEIYAHHVLEHVRNFIQLMQEVHRVCMRDSTVTIVVPHYSNQLAYSDPTHVRFFGLYTMCYFVERVFQPFKRKVPDFYIKEKFLLCEVVDDFEPKNTFLGRLFTRRVQLFINANPKRQEFYERYLCRFFPVASVRYVLSPVK